MKLKEVHVRLYKNFVDSGVVPIDEAVTCLVGKNESGKTAFLEALYSLKPAFESQVRVDLTMDYPRWRKVRDSRKMDLRKIAPIEATFTLEEQDFAALRKVCRVPLPPDTELTAQRSYGGVLGVKLSIPEKDLVEQLRQSDHLQGSLRQEVAQCTTMETLMDFVSRALKGDGEKTDRIRSLAEFHSLVGDANRLLTGPLPQALAATLTDLMPTFFYFSEYSSLEGRIDLTDLLSKPSESMKDNELTALALLALGGVSGPEFMETDFEVRVAELEAAANEVTRQVFEYWTQTEDLIVDLESDADVVPTPDGENVVHRFLDIRLDDLRHQMTTNLETRSSGFQWFLSFIVAFSEFEGRSDVIILLDEPGLGLHARAQAGLLRFIEERLAPHSQVIYTSHSPYTVNPKYLGRARLVEDFSSREKPEVGAKISTDMLAVSRDTLFPLQAALGYDLSQSLIQSGGNLLVESPSDLIFLTILSDHLERMGRTHLDPRFTMVPIGGADKLPAFIALLGARLSITVLVDRVAEQDQRVQSLIERQLLRSEKLISLSQLGSSARASVEDLFAPQEYLRLYNETFEEELRIEELPGTGTIVSRIERHRGSSFNRLAPALALLQNRDTHLSSLSEDTLFRFERLFELVNATLETDAT